MDRVVTISINREHEAVVVKEPGHPPGGGVFGPVCGTMMKQVCWHSRRSEAHRGLPEARPRTQNVMARGQSKAHGDSNLYNTRQD